MPRSAIDAGLADIIGPAEVLFERLVAYLGHAPPSGDSVSSLSVPDQSGLEKILILLRTHTGNDFSLYKKSTLYRRIERRRGLHQFDRMAHYVRYLQETPQERELLFKELLIGVTSFFREPPVWIELRDQILPPLLAEYPEGAQLRAWTAACSTGEEAYSLGMTFKEAIEQLSPAKNLSLQIFATDLDRDAIDKARVGLFPDNIGADVSSERLRRFFVPNDTGGYRIGKQIRDMVTLATQNVIVDPPFTKLDLLICRNLLIYLTPELQTKLFPLFHYSLKPGGILLLGSAETVGAASDWFTPLDTKGRFYQRKEASVRIAPVDFSMSFRSRQSTSAVPAVSPAETHFEALVTNILLERFTPAVVLANDRGDVLYIKGRTGRYLEPAAGRANWNLFAMAREGLREELPTLCQLVLRKGDPEPVHRSLRIKTNGDMHTVDLTLEVLREPPPLRGLLLLALTDAPASPKSKRSKKGAGPEASPDVVQLEEDLRHLRETLQSTRETMQTSQEELKSANEELQSTNEELQSTNEELTTSKEEMQSLNEELQTVNAELQAKVEALSRTNNDMKNLLNSTDIATLFLSDELHLRRFTTPAAKLIKLIAGDLGRPITDIAMDLVYPTLAADVTEVLRTLVFIEKPVNTRDERWFTARIMPYRTLDNRIDGVVVTFLDITTPKLLEVSSRRERDELKTQLASKTQELEQLKLKLQAGQVQGTPAAR
ncbi:MAG: CheR family methyltransferase [Myxococcales bacterium]